jgi:peptide/nickel transport system substrate-binding protein
MKLLRILTHSFALASIVIGCDSSREPTTDSATRGGGTAVLAEGFDMTLPTPLTVTVALDGNLADVMFMGLTRAAWEDGRLVHLTAERSPMALARSHEPHESDAARLRFHMRGDVRWSDGEPITAHDVVFTYQLARQPDLAFVQINYLAQIDSVVAENDTTVSFFFARRYPEMVSHASIGILPRHLFGAIPPAEFRRSSPVLEPGGGALVVSGPYRIEQWVREQQVVLEPNPHFRPAPHLERIVIRIIPDLSARLVELEAGVVDFVVSVPSDRARELVGRRPDLRAVEEQGRYYEFVTYNPDVAPLGEAAVRRALRQAVNLDRVLTALDLDGYATAASGPYSPIFADLYDPATAGPLAYDTVAARRALAEAGWTDSDGDGVVDRNGQPFRFTLETNAGNQRRADLAVLLQEDWRRIGVEVEIRLSEHRALISRVQQDDYEAALMAWGVGLSADLTEMWGPESPFNFARYQSERLDSLFAVALAQPTKEAARPHWRDAAALLAAEQPFNWLYYYSGIGVIGPRLQGMKVDTFGSYQNTWEWSVE